MNNKCRCEERVPRRVCRLFLTATLCVTISVATGHRVNVVRASGVIGQQQLELGKAVEREIAEGEKHSYRVRLTAGEFLHVLIYQRGVNLAATLIAPDGKKLLEADAPQSTQEAEWITQVATAAGEYSIEVRTVDKGTPAGRYGIRIEEKRKSASGDEARSSAQRAFTDGTRLFGEKNYRGAIEKYQEALAMYRQSVRRVEEAVTLNCIARSSVSLYDHQAAIEQYNEAVSIYHELSDLNGEGFTLHQLGNALFYAHRYDDAIIQYKQALEARRQVGYTAGEGNSLIGIGTAYHFQSRFEKAIEYFEQALERLRGVNDLVDEGRTLANLGNSYDSISQFEKAIEYFEHALAIFRKVKDRASEGTTLVNLGTPYGQLGRYERSIEYFEQSLAISRELKFRVGEGRALTNLGNVYFQLSRYDKAVEYYEQSLPIFRDVKDRSTEGVTLASLGAAYSSFGRYERAITYLEQALAIFREVKGRADEGSALNNLASAYSSLRQYEKAITFYLEALAIRREVKDRAGEGQTLNGLGEANCSLGRYGQAIANYEQALAISREVKNRAGEGNTLIGLMLSSEQQNKSPLAIFYGKQAVNVFQEIRGNIKTLDKESQQSYLKSHEDAYRKLADLLISQGRLAEAEKVLELLKEEEFNRVIRRNGPSDPRIGLTKTEAEAAKITDQLASLASEREPLLARIEKKTASDQDRQRLDLIETAITEANKQIKLVLADVAKASPDDKILTQQSQSMMQSLRKLGPGAVALYTVVTAEKGWVILTTPDFRRAYPINTTGLNQTISDFRLTLKSDRYDPVPPAQKLYTALLLQKNDEGATLAADLKSYRARTLMWSLDGVLRYVPLGALHDGKGYLVERYPTLVFTTASLTRLLDQVRRNWEAFGLGVSKEYKDFPALTAVSRELHSIIHEAGSVQSHGVLPGVIRLDEQFTRKAMIDGLHEGYPVVHVASHFRFNAEREETSFLLLGDGSYLSLEEMQNSPGIFEKVELLTLSACDTATTGANGKEVEGLAFVAQDLGAKAVVASLWPVADVGTEVLMREFYRLKRANPQWSKAEALRQAQIALLKGKVSSSGAIEEKRGPAVNEDSAVKTYKRDAKAPFAHPYYWAPFILIGNWK